MFIQNNDLPLVDAFLVREALDFGKTNQLEQAGFVERIRKEITKAIAKIPEADFLFIQSLTNLGLVQRELCLTPFPWKHGTYYEIYLPPSFDKGRVNIRKRDKR